MATAQDAEGDVELEGTLEILHEDRPDGSRYNHFLSTDDGKRWSVDGVPHGHDLLTGDRVRVRGGQSGKTIRLQQSSSTESSGTGSGNMALQVLAQAPLSNTFGVQKAVLLLVNFQNDVAQPTTVASMKSQMAWSGTFFQENSYQQTSVSTDVFGWFTLPISGGFSSPTCPIWDIQKYAEQAATAAGIPLSQYTKRIYLFPQIYACGFTGMSTVGGNPSSTWFNGEPVIGIVNHELGHSFGLYHSNGLDCHPNVISGSCSVQEYGDAFDTMGIGQGHFNAFQKSRLGWLDYDVSPPITAVTTSGTFTLSVYENAGSDPHALRIPRGTAGQSFYVEFRRNVGWDTYLIHTGVFVHLGSDSDPNSSWLLDMTPSTIPFSTDGFLDVGKSFTDPVSGITIRTDSVSSTSATIMVDMGGTGPLCTRSIPSVTASPAQSPAVQPGTTVTYNVSVKNTDSAGCSASSFTLQATAPTGWQKSFGASSVTTNPGTTVSTTLRITSPSVPSGAYTIVSAATSTTASPLSGSASMLYTVAPNGPPVPPGPAFTDTFDRPNSPMLGNGWSVLTGSLMIQSGEARNQSTSTFSLTVQPGLMGATQTVAASFASTNNNTGPRFGVVVRYQNPQNYYICYRQVGGSSVLRIAQVQNGAETILKSVGIGNPALNAFSTLSCQASGSTLTLRLDGVAKLSTSSGTFSTGSAGYAISTKGGSHRADNFSAIVQ
jgi:hypothetical protein